MDKVSRHKCQRAAAEPALGANMARRKATIAATCHCGAIRIDVLTNIAHCNELQLFDLPPIRCALGLLRCECSDA